MKLTDFDFDLPEDLIATRPARPRTHARLLLAEGDRITDRHVYDLIDIFQPGDRLILNNTKVIPARLTGHRTRGEAVAKIEVTLLEPATEGWRALAKPLRKVNEGEVITFSDRLSATVAEKGETDLRLTFNLTGDDFDAALAEAGAMPLPPYIAAKRAPDAQDSTDYQTVFARHAGAVAAPTASLHFDEPLLRALAAKGVDFTEVTLHVGAGTFLPVKVDDVTTHRMHAEWGQITPGAAAEINATKQAGGRIIPVGTTALRLLETAAQGIIDRRAPIPPFRGLTDLYILPGFQFRAAVAEIVFQHPLPERLAGDGHRIIAKTELGSHGTLARARCRGDAIDHPIREGHIGGDPVGKALVVETGDTGHRVARGNQVHQFASDVDTRNLEVVFALTARQTTFIELTGFGIDEVCGKRAGVAAKQRVRERHIAPKESGNVQAH